MKNRNRLVMRYTQWDLMSFAFCGSQSIFNEKISLLASLAEPEPWEIKGATYPNDILFYYITKQFARCNQQGLIVPSLDGDYCVSNTGLMTPYTEDIYCLFQKNRSFGAPSKSGKPISTKWMFIGFFNRSAREITSIDFPKEPDLPVFWEEPSEVFFDSSLPIRANLNHIIDDHWSREEKVFPDGLVRFGKGMVATVFKEALQTSIKRAKRNMFLVVPQFYDGKYMFLMPVVLPVPDPQGHATIALALEKQGNEYRGNTIFDLGAAYKKARLVNRPESNWLKINETK